VIIDNKFEIGQEVVLVPLGVTGHILSINVYTETFYEYQVGVFLGDNYSSSYFRDIQLKRIEK